MRLRLRARVLRARDGEFLYFHAPIFSFNLHLLNRKVLIDKSFSASWSLVRVFALHYYHYTYSKRDMEKDMSTCAW